jgi:para-aminobenzoate synthetase/4-amino-4-deoxychorismate lyase
VVGLPQLNDSFIRKQKYCMLFQTGLCDSANHTSYLFSDPVKIIKADKFDEVEAAFEDIERYSKGHYLAGFFAYELGYYFEQEALRLRSCAADGPLIRLAVFDKALRFDHLAGATDMELPGLFPRKENGLRFKVGSLKLNTSEAEYRRNIRRIKSYIRKGDTYQVNLTAKYKFSFSGSAFALYRQLAGCQHVQYSAFCKMGSQFILSLSPELFLRRDGRRIVSMPMKGTICRGLDLAEDSKRIDELQRSPKDKAENLMIVDLMRNDLGRISIPGSVRVSRAFRINKYDTVFQMTSEVSSVLREDVTYYDIFRNIFPGGSVTGAPKISTMRIISALEKGQRGIYCGALGIIFPGERALFNLPIRTLSIRNGKGEMGVGSGIVYDSSPDKELAECRLKAAFLCARHAGFKLIESIGWDNGYRFILAHLKRLRSSARYFDFNCNLPKVRNELKKLQSKFTRNKAYKVRVLLSRDGSLECGYEQVPVSKGIKTVAVSKHRRQPQDVFLRHKTTNRSIYDAEYRRARAKGCVDIIFMNTRNEFTEGAISNIIVEVDGMLYTPPLSCGVLPGVYRGYLIKKGLVKERVITPAFFKKAKRVFICNSVRGMSEVKVI